MALTRRHLLGGLAVSLAPLPVLAAARSDPDGFVTLVAKPGRLRLEPKQDTTILGFDGAVPGPLLRIRKGDRVRLRVVNGLSEPMAITWHGVRIVNAMDGVAGLTQKPVLPGAHFDYVFTPPDSGIYWYHANAVSRTAEQVAEGLYGVLIVEEIAPPSVDQETLIVVDDWALDASGQIANGERASPRLVTVNSRTMPETIEARPGARIRVRLLNVCAARIALVGIVGAAATVIAIDGQPSEVFQPARGTVPIGPGSRFELMVDAPSQADTTASLVLRGEGEPDRPLLQIKITGTPLPARGPVLKLPDNPLLPTRIPLEKSIRRDVVIAAAKVATPPSKATGTRIVWTINGATSDGWAGKPLFSVKRGGVVTLTIANRSDVAQQMHVHGHVWRLLHDLDDGWDPYWRESVLLAPGKTKHVAFIADNPGKWALVSSILDRQDRGLATWFEVT